MKKYKFLIAILLCIVVVIAITIFYYDKLQNNLVMFPSSHTQIEDMIVEQSKFNNDSLSKVMYDHESEAYEFCFVINDRNNHFLNSKNDVIFMIEEEAVTDFQFIYYSTFFREYIVVLLNQQPRVDAVSVLYDNEVAFTAYFE